MITADLQPLSHSPALYSPRGKLLVLADLHIGIEHELRDQGLHIPSQTHVLIQRLHQLVTTCSPKIIILLGDIKHNIPLSTKLERHGISAVLETFGSTTVHVVPGNHDGNIRHLLSSQVVLHPSNGCVFEGVGFLHGHRWPSEEVIRCKHIITAHTHPTVQFKDRLGHRMFEPCWLRSRFLREKLVERYPDVLDPEVVVMPAFNPLCGGIAANREQLVGPLAKTLDVANAQVYLLDGTSLGKICDIN